MKFKIDDLEIEMNMKLPNDPVMLLSAVNMKLRDQYASLDDLCEDFHIPRKEIEQKLAEIGYEYNSEYNRFA